MDSEVRRAIRYMLASRNIPSVCSLEEAKQLQKLLKVFINKETKKTSAYYATARHGHNAPANNVICEFFGYVTHCLRNKWQRQGFTIYQLVNGLLSRISVDDDQSLPNNGQDYIFAHSAVFSFKDAETRIRASYLVGATLRTKMLKSQQKAAETRARNQNTSHHPSH